MGVVIAVWMYSPRKRYRHAGVPTSIPYKGWKRWHTIAGLFFGVVTTTWAFSGLLSMGPFPIMDRLTELTVAVRTRRGGGPSVDARAGPARAVRCRCRPTRPKPPAMALASVARLRGQGARVLSFAGEPLYLATNGRGETRIIPVSRRADGRRSMPTSDAARARAGRRPTGRAALMDEYDAYYLDRLRERPLPVIYARMNDAVGTRYYIDPKTASDRRQLQRARLGEPLAVPRPALAGLPLAVQIPAAVGHRRHHADAGRHRAVRDVAHADVAGAGAQAVARLGQGFGRRTRISRDDDSIVDAVRDPRHPEQSSHGRSGCRYVYLKQVDLVEHDLVGLARAMPADKYDFRPAGAGFDGVRTFGEQVRHAATMIFMTAAIVLEEKSPYGPGVNDNGPGDIQGKDTDRRLPGGVDSLRAQGDVVADDEEPPRSVEDLFRLAAAHRGGRGRGVPQLQPLRADGRLCPHERASCRRRAAEREIDALRISDRPAATLSDPRSESSSLMTPGVCA